MTSVERLNSVIERENVSSQTFDDLEKSLNQGNQQEPEKKTNTPPDNTPNPSEPKVTGDDGGKQPPETEKGGAAGGQDTPNEPSVEKKDTEPNKNQQQQHTQEEKQEYAWQKLKRENKNFRSQNEQLTKQIKDLESQIAAFKETASKPHEELTEEQFATKADYLRWLAHDQNQKDFATLQNQQNEAYLKQLQEQQRMLVIAEREEALFPAEKRTEYVQVVNAAYEAGMKSALENNPDIMQFIDNSQMGPRILYHFAMMPKDMIAIAENPNPTTRQFMLAQLESGLYNHFVKGAGNKQQPNPAPNTNPNPAPNPSGAPNNPTPAQPKRNPPPIIGKVGGGEDNTDPDTLTEQEVTKLYRKVTT